MAKNAFDRDQMALWYANRHLNTDPGIRLVIDLPKGAPQGEIRLFEINELIAERENDPFEPLDFGVDIGPDSTHSPLVIDVTPAQWEKIRKNEIRLPHGWTLDGMQVYSRMTA